MTSELSREQLEAMLKNKIDQQHVEWAITRPDSRNIDRPVGCVENTKKLFEFYGLTCRYNEMTKELELKSRDIRFNRDTELNEAISYVRDCARKQDYNPQTAEEGLIQIAGSNMYNPARDWVLSKPWDGTDRLTLIGDAIIETENFDNALKQKMVKRWMIAAVASLMHNTEYASAEHIERGFLGTEGVLVLQGRQGMRKTQFFESLMPPRSGFFRDGVALDPNNKDSVALAISQWVTELGELDSIFRKSDVAALRAFLTKREDVFRPPYGKAINKYQRRTVFCGTVNDSDFLPETEENRRYWIISVDDVKRVQNIDIQQAWAQAFALYKNGEQFWFSPEERADLYASNADFERSRPLLDIIRDCVRKPFDANDAFDSDDVPRGASDRKYEKGEAWGATALIQYVQRTSAPPTAHQAGEIGKWLKGAGFKTATNKRFYLVVTKRWDPVQGQYSDV